MTALPDRSRSRALPFLAAVAVVLSVSTVAYAGRVPRLIAGHGIDKVLHTTMAATLTLLLARALRGRTWLAALLVLVPLALDEYLQRYSLSRSSDWADLAADVLGAIVAVVAHRTVAERSIRGCARLGSPSDSVDD